MKRRLSPKPRNPSRRRSSLTRENRRTATRQRVKNKQGRAIGAGYAAAKARGRATGKRRVAGQAPGGQRALRKLEKAVRSLLEAIGEDPARAGLRQTPARVARFYQRVFSGLDEDPRRQFKLFKVGRQDGLVVVRDIPFHSMCEHHLLPFFGRIHLAYVPLDNRVTGLNTLTRVTEVLSRRPQLQERLTNEIADTLMDCLRPRGLLVVIEAQHLCMSLGEGRKHEATAVSSAARGSMLDGSRRREALLMMNMPRAHSAGRGRKSKK